MKPLFFYLSALFVFTGCSSYDYEKVFIVHAGEHALINTPVYFDIENIEYNDNATLCLYSKHETVPGQIETLSESKQRIWWIVNLEAGKSARYGLRLSNECQSVQFTWKRQGKYSTKLSLGEQGVIQYEHPVFDLNNFEETQKPFHHVFEPAGNQFITKGGTDGLYPHHRGIFFGYNQIFFNDKRVNTWSSRDGTSEHAEIIREFTGPVMGGHTVKIYWKDNDGNPFIEEIRDVRVFRQPDGETLINFNSTLKTIVGPVRLEGDRQHAGVQFRAAQYVADNPHVSRFIRPSKLWNLMPTYEIDGKEIYDLPWNALYFKINNKPFTVSYMSHPSNPDNAEMSERLYGRFGEFIPYYLTADNPLVLKYRFWIKEEEEPTVRLIDTRYQVYANPVSIQKIK